MRLADEEYCGLRLLLLDVRYAIMNVLECHTLAQVSLKKLRQDSARLFFALSAGTAFAERIFKFKLII